MKFGTALILTPDVLEKFSFSGEMDPIIDDYFREKSYGSSVDRIVVGVKCQNEYLSEDLKFMDAIYSKRKRLVQYHILLDHKTVMEGELSEVKKYFCRSLYDSLDEIGKLTLKDFNIANLKEDVRILFEKEFDPWG